MNNHQLGELAYNAYYEHANGRTWNNYPMPLWADLPPQVQQQWAVGAAAVRRSVLEDVVAMLKATHEQELTERAALIEGAAL